MPSFDRLLAKLFPSAVGTSHLVSMTLLLALSSATVAIAQEPAKKLSPSQPKTPAIQEEFNPQERRPAYRDPLERYGEAIKFKSDLAGEVTVLWINIKELKSNRDFAIIPKDIKNSRDSEAVPQGAIKIAEKSIEIVPVNPAKSNADKLPPKQPQHEVAAGTVLSPVQIPTSKIGFVVDDASYLNEIHRKINWTSGWDGHIATGSTAILSTQNSFTLSITGALKRSVPTVSWLDPAFAPLSTSTSA